jgi:hypothetical protein
MRTMVLHPDIQTDRGRRDPGAALEEAVALAAALPDLEIVGPRWCACRARSRACCSGRARSTS